MRADDLTIALIAGLCYLLGAASYAVFNGDVLTTWLVVQLFCRAGGV